MWGIDSPVCMRQCKLVLIEVCATRGWRARGGDARLLHLHVVLILFLEIIGR